MLPFVVRICANMLTPNHVIERECAYVYIIERHLGVELWSCGDVLNTTNMVKVDGA